MAPYLKSTAKYSSRRCSVIRSSEEYLSANGTRLFCANGLETAANFHKG
jgi:hypothetical protein